MIGLLPRPWLRRVWLPMLLRLRSGAPTCRGQVQMLVCRQPFLQSQSRHADTQDVWKSSASCVQQHMESSAVLTAVAVHLL